MSYDPDPPVDDKGADTNPRAGRVPRLPLIIVLVILVIVAIVGALLSGGSKKDVKTAAETATSTTITAVPTSLESTTTTQSGPVMTGGFVPTPDAAPSTTATPAGGDECTAAALLASVKASGEVDPSIVDQATVASFKCTEPYAVAHLTASGAEKVDGYFVRSGAVWRLLVIGSDINPVQYGIPTEVAQTLK